jgi:hypothetical protein
MIINNNLIGICIIILLLIFYYNAPIKEYFTTNSTISEFDNRPYKVVGGFSDKNIAADKLAKLNEFIIQFLKYIKINVINNSNQPLEKQQFFMRILNNYNIDNIFENEPEPGAVTSFVANKGLQFGICLRKKGEMENQFHEIDILKFVMLHELTHLGCISYGHDNEFWNCFKVVLSEAVKSGLYTPIDYSKNPENYCGISVSNNPHCNANKC